MIREERVEHALSGEKRVVGGELLDDGPHLAHGPDLHHRVARAHALELELEHLVLQAKAHVQYTRAERRLESAE